MDQHSNSRTHSIFPLKALLVITIILCLIVVSTSAFSEKDEALGTTAHKNVNSDSVESVQAFLQVYKVLMSPRCLNCHPSGDEPLQGDYSRPHTMKVKRGKDGRGVYAAKCSNCHQPENTAGLHAPPGNPNWRLPPADMKMVFQGRTARELALQLMDYNKNGHKNKQELLEHGRDTLVKAGWNMGEGRTPPPLTYDAFLTAWDTWIQKGGYAPE